jgi:hypothetical protein
MDLSPSTPGWPLLVVALVPALALLHPAPGLADASHMAQTESYMVGPGSSVGPSTKVKPKNCRTNPVDGSITCDTELENSPTDTQARPQYELFRN